MFECCGRPSLPLPSTSGRESDEAKRSVRPTDPKARPPRPRFARGAVASTAGCAPKAMRQESQPAEGRACVCVLVLGDGPNRPYLPAPTDSRRQPPCRSPTRVASAGVEGHPSRLHYFSLRASVAFPRTVASIDATARCCALRVETRRSTIEAAPEIGPGVGWTIDRGWP